MARLTDRNKEIPLPCADNASFWARAHEKLARYEDAEEQGRILLSLCAIGDKVRDSIADHIFTVQRIETCNLRDEQHLIFRCGNDGTEDYMAFFDYEIGENITILTREEAEKALEGK